MNELLLGSYVILRFALYICAGLFLIWLITQVPEYGWWPTTVRVGTNMASAWLPDEERECASSPGKNGGVAEVDCYGDRPTDHNIPVKFWGKTDRNKVSLWKCRREKDLLEDHFVCRAIN